MQNTSIEASIKVQLDNYYYAPDAPPSNYCSVKSPKLFIDQTWAMFIVGDCFKAKISLKFAISSIKNLQAYSKLQKSSFYKKIKVAKSIVC